MDDLDKNPYVGPRTFREDEYRKFFGRNHEARDLISLVSSERLVLFYAQSGAGKSSLINARLRPGLRRRNFKLLPVGRVSGVVPQDIDDVENIFVFNLILKLDQDQHHAGTFSKTTLCEYLQQYHVITPADKETGRVLIIDQFEEIQTTNTEHWAKRKDFFEQLAKALDDDPLLWVVLALREDYVAGLDPYAHMLPGKLGTRYYMQRLNRQAALEAIKRPAERAGRPFEEGVAETLVDNLRQIQPPDQDAEAHYGQFVEAVQLQVVCYQLWENLAQDGTKRGITNGDLKRLAGGTDLARFVDKALAQFYNQAVQDVVQKHLDLTEFEVRDWFEDKLITKAQTRALVFENPKTQKTEGLDQDVVSDFQARFLLRGERRAGGQWYELVHDRFVDPILQANAEWRTDHPLLRDAREWKMAAKPVSKLYRGERLVEALDHPDATIALVQEFLAAGQKAEDEHRKALLADQQARTARILKWGITIISIITLIGIGLAIVARMEQGKAIDARATAEARRVEAEGAQEAAESAATAEAGARQDAEGAQEAAESAATAEAGARQDAEHARADAEVAATAEAEARQDAEAALVEAEKQEKIANSRRLATAAVESLKRNPKLGLLLAIEAVKESTTSEAETALRQAIDTSRVQAILSNHTDNVNALAFSPNGRFVVTVSDDTTARVWEVETGNQITTIEHDAEVLVVTFSRGGRFLATGSRDGKVRVLRVVDLEDVTQIDHQAEVSAITFNPDGTLLVTAGVDGKARVWEIPSGNERQPLEGHTNQINAVALSPEGRRIATASLDGTARLWDSETGEQLAVLSHQPGVNAVAFSKDGVLVTGGVDGAVRLWNAERGELISELADTGAGSITAIAFNQDGTRLAAGSTDSITRLWDTAQTDSTPLRLSGHRDRITAVDFSLDGKWLVTASADSTARLWDVSSGKLNAVFEGHTSSINVVAFSPGEGQALFATASSDNTARLWTLDSTGAQTVLRGHEDVVFGLAFNHDGSLLASRDERSIHLWDVSAVLGMKDSRTELANLQDIVPVSELNFSLAFSPNGDFLAASGFTEDSDPFVSTVQLWDVSTLLDGFDEDDLPFIWESDRQAVFDLTFSPDGNLLAVGGLEIFDLNATDSLENATGFVRLWDISTLPMKEANATLLSPPGEIIFGMAISSSPDTRLLATSSLVLDSPSDETAGSIRLWDISNVTGTISSGAETAVIPGPGFIFVTFSPDGKLLASSSGDGTVKLWDVSKLRDGSSDSEVAVLQVAEEFALGVAFSPDGELLATGGEGETVRLWDVATIIETGGSGAEIATLRGHEAEVIRVAFHPDGSLLASAGGDGTVRLWVIGIDSLLELACQQATRNMTQNEWDKYFGDEPYRQTCENRPIHLTAAQEYVRHGKIDEALVALSEAKRLDPTLPFSPTAVVVGVLIDQSEVYVYEGKFDEAVTVLQQAHELDPTLELAFEFATVARALVTHAEKSIRRDDFEGALAAYQQADELDPTLELAPNVLVAAALVERSLDYVQQGDDELTLTTLKRAKELDPALDIVPEAQAKVAQAIKHARENRADEALAALRQANDLDSSLEVESTKQRIAAVLVEEANQATSQRQYEEALAFYRRANELAPILELEPEKLVAAAIMEQMERRFELGEYDQVLTDLRRVAELDPTLIDGTPEQMLAAALLDRADQFASDGAYDEALTALAKAVELDPTLEIVPEAEVALARGRDLARQGAADEALAALREALGHDPTLELQPEVEVAAILARQAQNHLANREYDEALAAFEKAVELDPTLEIVPEAEVALARGRDLARQGAADEALAALRAALEHDPTLELQPEVEVAAILARQAQTHLDNREYDEALAAFEKAVALDPTLEIVPEAEVALARGRDLARQGATDEALAALRAALEHDPTLVLSPEVEVAAILARQAQNHLANREYDEALTAFERAIELDPTLEIVPAAEVALARGRDLADEEPMEGVVASGNYLADVDEALAALEQAIQLDPQIEERRASDFASVYEQVCGKSRYYGFSTAILTACERAVELAIETEDVYLNSDICRNGNVEGLAEIVSPACEKAVELAVETGNTTLNRDLCQIGSVEELTEVVLPACARAVELAVETERATLNRDLCRIGSVEGLSEVVLPACTRAVELAIETEDVTLNRELCQIEAVNGLTDAVQPACERAAELTKGILPGETATGRVSPGGSYAWTFEGKAGQTVTITMKAVNDGFDTYLSLLGQEGPPPLITNDDDPALGLNSRIAGFELPQDGPYVIIATGLNEDDSGSYTLSLVVEDGE